MSIRVRLLAFIAVVLVLSVVLGGLLAGLSASSLVRNEMQAALTVAQQTIAAGIENARRAAHPRAEIERLILSFKGNRHVRVYLTDDSAAVAAPASEMPPIGSVPSWFVRFIGVPSTRIRIPFSTEDHGSIVIETMPHNEILERWEEFTNSLLVLAAFCGGTMAVVYVFVGRALRPLSRLDAALAAIGRGDYGIRLQGRLPRELYRLYGSFNRMAGQLAAVEADNRRLSQQLLTLQEEERGEIAGELHDEIGSFLFAINLDAMNISRQLRAGRPDRVAGHVESIGESVAHMQRQVKSMLHRLRPIGLAEFGLAEAIGNLVDSWRRRCPGIDYRLDLAPDCAGVTELLDTTVYRIVQESLVNALRHGQPAAVSVTVRREAGGGPSTEGPDRIVVLIVDDGRGTPASFNLGYGLLGMNERVKAIGGSLAVSADGGAGVTVRATLPCPPRERLPDIYPVAS